MVIIVMGVSGAGKTTVGRALADKLGWQFADGDEFHPAANIQKMRSGTPLTDNDRDVWLRLLNEMIRKWIREGRNVVLACSALRAAHRRALRAGIEDRNALRFVYLKGAFEDISPRLRHRTGHFMPESLLQSQFDTLEEPDVSEALIIDARRPVDQIGSTIIAALHLGIVMSDE